MGGGSNTFCKKRKRKGRRGGTATHNQQCKSSLFSFSLSQGHTIRVGKTILEREGEEQEPQSAND